MVKKTGPKKKVVKFARFDNWADQFGYPIAHAILPYFLRFSWLSPNHITLFAFFLFVLGCFFLTQSFSYHNIIAAFLLFSAYIGDDLDGQFARAANKCSVRGDYLDKVIDVIKIFLLTITLAFVSFLKTDNYLYFILGFTACFFFNFRYYIKLETMFSMISRDDKYLEKSQLKREELESIIRENDKKMSRTVGGKLKFFWNNNKHLFAVDEAEFVIITALFLILNKPEIALIILGISQLIIGLYRMFLRMHQLHVNSEKLIEPLRK